MSKEAIGQHGSIAGTADYFGDLNSGTLIAGFLPEERGYDYHGGLETLASRAAEAIEEIYEDLREHEGILRYVPAEKRSRVSELVTQLQRLCGLACTDSGNAGECLSMLALSGLTGMTRSMATDSELEAAAEVISTGGGSGLDSFSRESTVKEAVSWGDSFAIGSDEQRRAFLQELKHNRAMGFLDDAWDYYNYRKNPDTYFAHNGCAFCGENYVAHIEARIFPRIMASAFMQTDYAEKLHSELLSIILEIDADVANARQENDYLTDANGDRLIEAVQNLYQCNVSASFALAMEIDALKKNAPPKTPYEDAVEHFAHAVRASLAAAGLNEEALAALTFGQAPEENARKGNVYGFSLGASVAWGLAVSGELLYVWDDSGNGGVAITTGFGGGLGICAIGRGDFLEILKGAASGAGTKFEGCYTIWDIEGPGVSIGATLGIFNADFSVGKNTSGEDTSAGAIGGNKAGLGFHALITGTKLLFTFNIPELLNRLF